ncbi:Coenzyme F420 hydrogenase/dehydrogenase, beta subunit C-terminal domain [Butyricicoccus porcorum]|uniref:Hydrogenase n=1 Tax=Butyricicoccus porcorum TaxID=1945634 RepID=A0A252F3J8_9FIRM|nr:Coenzyme F420 hydrogenase/dehydrogenase, beta subunit C-terminal domain [Butyricicoccus porcorum]OUM20302.1 hydrogenase [Butyricicoccus porcorum]
MIQISDKRQCCGCEACMNACPNGCITMRADKEGFLYPEIEKQRCMDCGLCERVCPVIQVSADIPFEQNAYVVQIKDEKIRRESTSGGSFSAIAEYVLSRNGIVFGASYDRNFKVLHTKAESRSEMSKFRNSKYVQSDTGTTFRQVQQSLEEGRWVCYSGTPCQIEGLKAFLRKEYEKLITVDVVCRAVPSPLVWGKYVEMQKEKFGSDISNIMFRDKYYGYKYSTMTVKDRTGKSVYAFGIDTDPMLRAFFSNICDRPSCYDCKFKKRYRVSDFTIWDCYPVYDFDKALDDDKGTTRVLVHTEKGNTVFNEIRENLRYTVVSPDKLTKGFREMFESVEENAERTAFFADASRMSGKALFNKYYPETLKVKLERTVRIFCYHTGIYSVVKRTAKRILKR